MKLDDIKNVVMESSLSRVYSHFKGAAPCAIITAFRGDRDNAENVALNRELAATLRGAGYGFIWVDGAWIENKGTDAEIHASEVSIMVFGQVGSDEKLFSLLVESAKKYNQDGFIFKGSDTTNVAVYDKDGNSVVEFNRINMDTVSDMYTRMRGGKHAGRSFVFESERSPIGFIGRMMGKTE